MRSLGIWAPAMLGAPAGPALGQAGMNVEARALAQQQSKWVRLPSASPNLDPGEEGAGVACLSLQQAHQDRAQRTTCSW